MAASTVLKFVVLSLAAIGLTAEKIRPCPDFDNACVGQYLADYSSCSVDSLPTDQTALDPYSLEHFYFYSPYFNVTEDRYNVTIEGQSQTYVKDFYYNDETNKAVLVLFLPYTRFEGDSILHLLQTGEDETVDATTHYVVSFVNITLTTVFEDYQNLELSKSFTFPDLPFEPTYENADLPEESAADVRVAALVAAINAQPSVGSLEAFVYRAPSLVKLFTNYKLCVFSS